MNSNQLWLQKVFPGPLWLCLVEQTPLSRCCPEQLLWCSLLLPQHTFTTYTTHTRLYAFLVSLSFVCLWSHQTAYVMTEKIQRVYNYTVLIQLCYLRCFVFFGYPQRNENAPLKFEVCHGPVSSKQNVCGISLHAFSVALHSYLVFSLFKVSIAL